ncbi:MAG TPA: hypothetical protein VFU76_01375 [Terriglobales bacterium]|nr:hypothetical protein [Terriglobales bacterium]
MLQFVCDWCRTVKEPGQHWLLGFAAEEMGVTAARREVQMLSGWDRDRAVLPLAVHFCCTECKDNFVRALFETREPLESEIVVKRKRSPEVLVERRYQRTTTNTARPKATVKRHTRVVKKGSRRRAA